ncbi:hypothetical protein R1sor_023293 [Riccia sorocarpa]|uniref:DDE Tnp4 domain-containing protein n=1 Tax=Riccia sorocarpa TaxID=122646 RepID=A0ABD3GPD0_9MARC
MESDGCAYPREVDPQSPGVEEDILVEDVAAALSPASLKLSDFHGEVTPPSEDNAQINAFPFDVNQNSHFDEEEEENVSNLPTPRAEDARFSTLAVQSPQTSAQHGETVFSTQGAEGKSHLVARGEPASGNSAGEEIDRSPEFEPEDERDTGGSTSYLPAEHHQGSDHGIADQVGRQPGEDSGKANCSAPDHLSSSQLLSPGCNEHSRVLSADEEGTSSPAENGLASQSNSRDEGAICPVPLGQDLHSLDQEKEDGGQSTALRSRKRKLAVFAAAGAVIAIQTMLVAMPEIWQPLEDDESAEKVAYQEGLHSWFGALNRAAWLLSTANGAGDGGWWVKPRASVWFTTHLMSSNEDERWLAALRMKRKTFLWICNRLEIHVKKQDTRLRPSIPVMVRVGATIYRLINGVDYYEVADKFGVGESSVHEIMQDCVPAIVKVFGHHLNWPTGEAMAEVSRSFHEKCGLPNCQGTIGSTHVEILNPTGPEARKYINKTGHFSVVLQAVADSSFSLLDVFCGYPERTYDNKVLRNSSLYRRVLAGEILAGPIQSINGGFQLRPYILGGSNYPLHSWLMVPYSASSPLSYSQEQFIHRHEQGNVYAQQAVGILKRVFRVLGVGIRGRLELVPVIVQACCLLYNILIRRKELDVEAELEQMGPTSHVEDNEEGHSKPGDAFSQEIRNQLSEYLVLGIYSTLFGEDKQTIVFTRNHNAPIVSITVKLTSWIGASGTESQLSAL